MYWLFAVVCIGALVCFLCCKQYAKGCKQKRREAVCREKLMTEKCMRRKYKKIQGTAGAVLAAMLCRDEKAGYCC